MKRRKFLQQAGGGVCATSVSALAGCSSGPLSYEFEFVGDEAWDTQNYQSQGYSFYWGGRIRLNPGEWYGSYFSSPANLRIDYTLRTSENAGIELFFVDEDEYDKFAERNNPEILHHAQLQGNENHLGNTRITTREFNIIFENTGFGERGPSDETSVVGVEIEGRPI